MSSGMLLSDGQKWILESIKSKIDISGGLYIGLLTNSSNIPETYQLPTYITELTGSGYFRQLSDTWVITTGVDPYIMGSTVTFTVVSGSWLDINGYFVSLTSSGNDALWTEQYSSNLIGTKTIGEKILITPVYEQK